MKCNISLKELEKHKDELSDDIVNSYFYGKKLFITRKLEDIPQYLQDWLLNRYDDSQSIEETIKRIHLKIDKHPTCKWCGKPLKFIGKPSQMFQEKFCCKSCLSKSNSTVIEQKYGTKCTLTLDDVKNKSKNTLIQHYGVDHNFKSKEVWTKTYKTKLKKYGEDYSKSYVPNKTKQTCQSKYGNENYRNTKKAKATCLNKYGVDHPQKLKTISCQTQKKRLDTLAKNHTWNKSDIEEKFAKWLSDNNIHFIRQYKSDLYPFNCDFYIVDYDLYVEIQGSHFHHYHPFNKNDIQDLDELRRLEEKNDGKNQYGNIIKTWTILDVIKRDIAKKNKLNYLEIFTNNIYDAINIFKNKIE